MLYLLAMNFANAQVPLDVDFKLTDLEYAPLAGVPVRLVFGAGKDWQGADAGNRIVTADNGEARFTTTAFIEREWRTTSFFFVPVPGRVNHLMIAAELERSLPLDDQGKQWSARFLHTMDIYSYGDGHCVTNEFMNLYRKDESGCFAQPVPRAPLPAGSPGTAWKVPELGNQLLWGMGYKPSNFSLRPDASGQGWTLKLAIARLPLPVRR